MDSQSPDMVNSPPHYQLDGLEAINGTSATPGILSFETESKRPVNIRIN